MDNRRKGASIRRIIDEISVTTGISEDDILIIKDAWEIAYYCISMKFFHLSEFSFKSFMYISQKYIIMYYMKEL